MPHHCDCTNCDYFAGCFFDLMKSDTLSWPHNTLTESASVLTTTLWPYHMLSVLTTALWLCHTVGVLTTTMWLCHTAGVLLTVSSWSDEVWLYPVFLLGTRLQKSSKTTFTGSSYNSLEHFIFCKTWIISSFSLFTNLIFVCKRWAKKTWPPETLKCYKSKMWRPRELKLHQSVYLIR